MITPTPKFTRRKILESLSIFVAAAAAVVAVSGWDGSDGEINFRDGQIAAKA